MKRFIKTLAAIVATTIVFAACSNIMDDLKVRPASQPEPTTTPTPAPAPEQTPTPTPEPTPAPEPSALATPLTLEAIVAGAVVTFDNKAAGPVTYKVNSGAAQTIASGTQGSITLAAVGDKVEFFGDNKAYATSTSNYSNIACDKDCYVYGNIMSLVKREHFENATALEEDYTFAYFFRNNAHIKNKDGAPLLLPANTLANYCYNSMFDGCTSLKAAPSLPANTLANHCYYYMFQGCTSLTAAPALPATTLAVSCYYSMFSGCTSLKTAPSLPATTLAGSCYAGMFFGCTSLKTAPALPATTLAVSCYYSMFYGCTSLTAAPSLPATTLAGSCYVCMFQGCASLASVTCLATDISASNCTTNWLDGVAASGTFTKAPEMNGWTRGANGIPKGWNVLPPESVPLTLEAAAAGAVVTFSNKASGPVTYKVNGGEAQTIASNSKGTITLTNIGDKIEFFGNNTRYATYLNNYSHITCDKDCYVYGNIMSLINSEGFESETTLTGDYAFLGLFEGNTTIKNKDGADLLLPATTLASYCYCNMFDGCASLTAAPSLPATTLAKACYAAMFYDCRSLTIAPSLPATNLTESCYGSMFSDCKSLATAPLLSANMLVQGCYAYMFQGCEILNNITCLATDISTSGCIDCWLDGVASSGTFTKAASATWPEGINGIPSGWSVVEQ